MVGLRFSMSHRHLIVSLVLLLPLLTLLMAVPPATAASHTNAMPSNAAYWLTEASINDGGGLWYYYLTDSDELDSGFGIGSFTTAEYIMLMAELYEDTGRSDIQTAMMEAVDYLLGMQYTTGGNPAYGGFASAAGGVFFYSADALVSMYALSRAYTTQGSSNATIRTALDDTWTFLRSMQTGNDGRGLVDSYYGGFMRYVRSDNQAYLTQLWANDGYGFAEGLYLYYQISSTALVLTSYTDYLDWLLTSQEGTEWFYCYYNPLPYGTNLWYVCSGTWDVYTDNNFHTGYALARGWEILSTGTYLTAAQNFDTYYDTMDVSGAWQGYTDVINDAGNATYDDRVVSAYATEIRTILGRDEDAPANQLANWLDMTGGSDEEGGMRWTDSGTTTQLSSSATALGAWALERYTILQADSPEVLWADSLVRGTTWDGDTWVGHIDAAGVTVMYFHTQPVEVAGASSWTWDSTRNILTITTTAQEHLSPARVAVRTYVPGGGGRPGWDGVAAFETWCRGDLTMTFSGITSTSDPIILYTWDFGDGSRTLTMTESVVRHTFPGAGVYSVTHIVITSEHTYGVLEDVDVGAGACLGFGDIDGRLLLLIGLIIASGILWTALYFFRKRKVLLIAGIVTVLTFVVWLI